MRLVAGLGNPGSDYDGTRHNAGFDVVDLLASRHGVALRARECQALVGRGRVAEEPVLLAKPQTFMNHSGEAVSGLLTKHGLDLSDLLVVSDDIDLPLGILRLRAAGSSGGQKGLRSIEQCVGSREYARLRIGIRGDHYRGGGYLSDYVLERFG